MTILTQGRRTAEFLLSEANGARSREAIVVNAGAGKLEAGTLLAQLTAANAATPSAAGGNTGNGSLGTVGVGNEAITGTYVLTVTAAASDGGDFQLLDPFGRAVGSGTVGVEFSAGGLTFTLSDGSTDFIVGDAFDIAVNAGLGEWLAYDDSGADDGRRAATGILYAAVDAREDDADAVAIVRDAEVVGSRLTGLDANGQADLLTLGILVR